MRSVNEVSRRSFRGRLGSLLAGKPVWVFWAVYTVLSGLLLGISYAAVYFLVQRWWGAAIAVVAAGMIWGSLAHKPTEPDTKGTPEI